MVTDAWSNDASVECCHSGSLHSRVVVSTPNPYTPNAPLGLQRATLESSFPVLVRCAHSVPWLEYLCPFQNLY